MNTLHISMNKEHNGIELSFAKKPDRSVLKVLKETGFRWHRMKQIWYTKQSEKAIQAVEEIKNLSETEQRAKEMKLLKANDKEQVNDFGIRIGDIFVASWGYDQTNLNFYQVVSLAGKSSVRVIEINPVIIEEKHPKNMSRQIRVKNDNTMMERKSFHQFIKDNEHGDLKRVSDKGFNVPYIKVSDYYAKLYKGELMDESWYA